MTRFWWFAVAFAVLALVATASNEATDANTTSNPFGTAGSPELQPSIPGRADLTGYARVIDGDTIEVASERIRLSGIDAPERRQYCTRHGDQYECGQAAQTALNELVSGRQVECSSLGRDRYRRVLATCTVAGTDIGGAMVQEGWAVAYRRYSDRYVGDERIARSRQAGIWSGEFEEPEQWRRDN